MSYTAWYGFGRFFIEGLRTDSLMLGGLRVSQLLAALSFAAAAALLIVMFVKSKKGRLPRFAETSDADAENGPDDIPDADDDLTPSEYSEIISEMEQESRSGDMTEDELGENSEAAPDFAVSETDELGENSEDADITWDEPGESSEAASDSTAPETDEPGESSGITWNVPGENE